MSITAKIKYKKVTFLGRKLNVKFRYHNFKMIHQFPLFSFIFINSMQKPVPKATGKWKEAIFALL